MMESYRLVDGCHNCIYCRVETDPESISYWCWAGSKPPIKRSDYLDTYEGCVAYTNAVEEWIMAGNKEELVKSHGICDDWSMGR